MRCEVQKRGIPPYRLYSSVFVLQPSGPMPKFAYTARDGSGAALSGEVVARSESDAVRLLRGEGKFVTRMDAAPEHELAGAQLSVLGGSRVRGDDVIFFCTQLAGMVDTGVPIAEALEATIDGAPPGGFRRVVEQLIARVQGGLDFSAALAEHPRVFPPLFIHLVRASEATGTMGPMPG
jgi:type IV pilus assembly protein PilC